jgi:hypothetical protein
VRLLFDHNLSPRLVAHLADIFPGSEHVHALRLHEASDRAVWEFAREQGCTIYGNRIYVAFELFGIGIQLVEQVQSVEDVDKSTVKGRLSSNKMWIQLVFSP